MRAKPAYRIVLYVINAAAVIGFAIAAYFTRDYWLPLVSPPTAAYQEDAQGSPVVDEPKTLKISPQARANLDLVSRPAIPQTYWRKIQIPGVVVDRPGVTDRGITSPVSAVITQIHAFEGDIVQPRQKLFSLRLVSEYLQKTQADLFKAIRETEILRREIARIRKLAESGVLPEKRIIELDQQVLRQNALIETHRQELLARGLEPSQIEKVEIGEFLTNFDVITPEPISLETLPVGLTTGSQPEWANFFEIQDLKVELGQQVAAGQVLATLANHHSLYIKGHAFKKEASNLARAAERGWKVDVEFTEDSPSDWPAIAQSFQIRHLANATDPISRTFDFFIPLTNQSRVYEKNERPFVIWRFRPGQRVRIHVPVEEMKNVIVLPAGAVAREGPEAYVFQQNGNLFNRIGVQILHQDRTHVILANDGSVSPGFFLAQGSAASLNRVLKAQSASGIRADIHVHADGTTHAAH